MYKDAYVEETIKAKTEWNYYLKVIGSIFIVVLGLLLWPKIGMFGPYVIILGIVLLFAFGAESKVEYEFIMTNSNIQIDAIYNASRRKEKFQFDLENVTLVVPANSNRINPNDKFVKKYSYTSKKEEGKCIAFILERNKTKELVTLELGEKGIEHVKNFTPNIHYDI